MIGTARDKRRHAPGSFCPGPTSSPASSTPRCAASGLDLGPGQKEGHPCRQCLTLSFVPRADRRARFGQRVCRGNRARKKASGALPLKPHQGALPLGTPPRASPWNPLVGCSGRFQHSTRALPFTPLPWRVRGLLRLRCGSKIDVCLVFVSQGWGSVHPRRPTSVCICGSNSCFALAPTKYVTIFMKSSTKSAEN